LLLNVESRPGLHGDREPVSFQLGDQRIGVLQIIDRWIAYDHSYFKIEASDGGLYILRFTPPQGPWELTLFQAPPSAAPA
jgi:hypothetical protein